MPLLTVRALQSIGTQAVAPCGGEAASVRLGVLALAQLDGFKSRALRAEAEAPSRRDLYVTDWRATDVADVATGAAVLVIGDESEGVDRAAAREEGTPRTPADGERAAVSASATGRASLGRLPLSALEVALALVQTQGSTAHALPVRLLTAQSPQQTQDRTMGSWGVSRSARAEAALPLACVDAPASQAALEIADMRTLLRERGLSFKRLQATHRAEL